MKKRKRQGEDLTSLLPDEMLVAILSFLTIKEAGKCSTLSRRWRFLWTYFTGKFEYNYKRILCWDRSMESSCISKILKRHRGSVMDEFVIHFPGKSTHSSEIDSWVYFASEKNVRKLELDLLPIHSVNVIPLNNHELDLLPIHSVNVIRFKNHYEFPSIERISSDWNGTHRGFTSLTSLRLIYVDVTGKVLEYFLATCSFLKELVVKYSTSLEFLEISGEALRLESLEVYRCTRLKRLIISADKLVSLTFSGSSKSLVLKNDLPCLSKLEISGLFSNSIINMSCEHIRYIQHLECLKMKFFPEVLEYFKVKVFLQDQPPVSTPRLPKMYRLKHLELDLQLIEGSNYLYYTSLIEACPLLSRFSMRVSSRKVIPVEVSAPDFEHECLKVVELIGYAEKETEFQLAFHLLKIAVSIEKLIIVFNPGFVKTSRQRERIRKKLALRLPISAKLVML